MKQYDIIVVGTGGATIVADAALKKGLKVAIIEKGKFGGTCLTRGCIPTKVMVTAANAIQEVEEFKNNTCLDLSGYTSDIGTRNLKMIALIKDNPKIKLDDSDYISSMINQANSFESITLQVNNNRFIILSESDLSQFLKLALGRYYINPLTDDKMIASTTKVIN